MLADERAKLPANVGGIILAIRWVEPSDVVGPILPSRILRSDFKERFNGHQCSMRHRSHRNSTALSKYVWSLKEKNTEFNIRPLLPL